MRAKTLTPIFGVLLGLSFCLSARLTRAAADTSASVGTVRTQGRAFIDGEEVRNESAVYIGDFLTTGEGLATLSLAHGDLLMVDRNSEVYLQRLPQGIQAVLRKGQVRLAAAGSHPVGVEAGGVRFSPAGTSPSAAKIALRDNGELIAVVDRGAISVVGLRRAPVVLTAGKLLKVSPGTSVSREVGLAALAVGVAAPIAYETKQRIFEVKSNAPMPDFFSNLDKLCGPKCQKRHRCEHSEFMIGSSNCDHGDDDNNNQD